MDTNFLNITWSTSRGMNSYGWNICRLDDSLTGRRFRTCGGGYDMIGTVLGEWLAATYQDRLRAIGLQAGSFYSKASGYKTHRTMDGGSLPFGRPDPAYLYGMTRNDDTGAVTIDGACGVSSVCAIAAAIGLRLSPTCNRRGHVNGYMVTDTASAQAA